MVPPCGVVAGDLQREGEQKESACAVRGTVRGEGTRAGVGVGSVLIIMDGRRPSHPYKVGTKHVGFSPIRQTLLAPSAKHRKVFG